MSTDEQLQRLEELLAEINADNSESDEDNFDKPPTDVTEQTMKASEPEDPTVTSENMSFHASPKGQDALDRLLNEENNFGIDDRSDTSSVYGDDSPVQESISEKISPPLESATEGHHIHGLQDESIPIPDSPKATTIPRTKASPIVDNDKLEEIDENSSEYDSDKEEKKAEIPVIVSMENEPLSIENSNDFTSERTSTEESNVRMPASGKIEEIIPEQDDPVEINSFGNEVNKEIPRLELGSEHNPAEHVTEESPVESDATKTTLNRDQSQQGDVNLLKKPQAVEDLKLPSESVANDQSLETKVQQMSISDNADNLKPNIPVGNDDKLNYIPKEPKEDVENVSKDTQTVHDSKDLGQKNDGDAAVSTIKAAQHSTSADVGASVTRAAGKSAKKNARKNKKKKQQKQSEKEVAKEVAKAIESPVQSNEANADDIENSKDASFRSAELADKEANTVTNMDKLHSASREIHGFQGALSSTPEPIASALSSEKERCDMEDKIAGGEVGVENDALNDSESGSLPNEKEEAIEKIGLPVPVSADSFTDHDKDSPAITNKLAHSGDISTTNDADVALKDVRSDASVSKDKTPVVDDDVPTVDDENTPVTEDEVPNVDKEVPADDAIVTEPTVNKEKPPATDDEVPAVYKEVEAVDKDAIVTKVAKKAPVDNEKRPVTNSGVPIVDKEIPTAKDDAIVTEETLSVAKEDPLFAENEDFIFDEEKPSATKDEVPTIDKEVPADDAIVSEVAKEDPPVAENEASTVDEENPPVTDDEVPTVHKEGPAAKDDATKTEETLLVLKEDPPIGENEAFTFDEGKPSVAKDEVPTVDKEGAAAKDATEETFSVAKDETPTVDKEIPAAKDDAIITEVKPPVAEDETPTVNKEAADDKSPATEHKVDKNIAQTAPTSEMRSSSNTYSASASDHEPPVDSEAETKGTMPDADSDSQSPAEKTDLSAETLEAVRSKETSIDAMTAVEGSPTIKDAQNVPTSRETDVHHTDSESKTPATKKSAENDGGTLTDKNLLKDSELPHAQEVTKEIQTSVDSKALDDPVSTETKPSERPTEQAAASKSSDENTVYLYMSMASGVRGSMSRFNRATTILKSYNIDFIPVEITLDEKAKRQWKYKGLDKGKILPAVFRDGDLKCDYNELVEANEIEDVEDLIFDGL